MPIKGLEKYTTLDYTGKDAAVIFFGGCNLRCPHCQNPELINGSLPDIPKKDVLDFLKERRKWLDGVVLSGGEPTMQWDLVDFIREIKDMGFSVKLDTNGVRYDVLLDLKDKGLVDYVAMDVKGPPSLYSNLVGMNHFDLRDNVEKGMFIATQFPDYEFRTTVGPIIRNGEISFMCVGEAVDSAKYIVNVTGSNEHKYFLQKFIPRKEGLLDRRLEDFPETSNELLSKMREKVKIVLPKCEIRN